MKTITKEELNRALEQHKVWLEDNSQGKRLDLRGYDLSGMDLRGRDLSGANLSGTDLRGYDLIGCDLSGANLSDCDFSGCNLYGANLAGCDLSGSKLTGANLTDTYLCRANLTNANLTNANLTNANLTNANLAGAILPNTDKFYCTPGGFAFAHIRHDYIRIGCEYHPVEEWRNFTDEEINKMDKGFLRFWEKNKSIIMFIADELKGKKNEKLTT